MNEGIIGSWYLNERIKCRLKFYW